MEGKSVGLGSRGCSWRETESILGVRRLKRQVGLRGSNRMAREAKKQPPVPTLAKLLFKAFRIVMSRAVPLPLGDRWREWKTKGLRGIMDQYPLCSQLSLILWSPHELTGFDTVCP